MTTAIINKICDQAIAQNNKIIKDTKKEFNRAINNIKPKQYKRWECNILNIIDVRYWFCECGYYAPYGKVISAGCKRHD
jgi:hypothetical protein